MSDVIDTMTICRWSEIEARDELIAPLDRIFFEASQTRAFASPAIQAAFRERWLGRYLAHDPQLAFLAFDGQGCTPAALTGYVVGALDDPARGDRFADIGYFPSLAPVTRRFPAHLHINLAPKARGAGLGRLLIARFIAELATSDCPGVHVVTGAASRNTRFYKRCGFDFEHHFTWAGSELVLLGRTLHGAAARS